MSPAPLTRRAGTRKAGLERVLRVMRLLREPRTLSWLAQRLGCHERTVRRDIDLLRAVGVPVWRHFEAGWVIDQDRKGAA